jgi:autotransporter-associated beta strand protein
VLAFAGNAGITVPGLNTSNNTAFYFHTLGNLDVGSILNGTTGGLVKTGEGTLSLNARSYYTGTTTINDGVLRFGVGSGNNAIVVTPTGTVAALQPLVVNSGMLDLNGFNQAVGTLSNNNALPVGGTITNTSGTAATLVSVTGAASTFGGILSGNLAFDVTGNNARTLTNASTHTGGTVIRGNTLTLRDNGSLSGAVAVNFAALNWDNGGLNTLATPNPSRISASAPVTLQGGTFSLTGGGSIDTTATLNSIIIQRGGSTINVLPLVNQGSTAQLNIGNIQFTAADRSVVNFSGFTSGTNTLGGSGLNANGRILISTINGAGFSAASMTNNLIGGWAVANGSTFATYRDDVGIGEMGSNVGGLAFPGFNGTDITLTTTTAVMNINDSTSRTLTTSKTVNSLRMAPGAAQTLTLGNATTPVTLTLGVGLITNAGFATNIAAGNAASALTSSGSDLFVFVNQNTTSLNTKITGATSLVKSGGATLTLNPGAGVSNDYSGGTFVNGGTLNLSGAASTSAA